MNRKMTPEEWAAKIAQHSAARERHVKLTFVDTSTREAASVEGSLKELFGDGLPITAYANHFCTRCDEAVRFDEVHACENPAS